MKVIDDTGAIDRYLTTPNPEHYVIPASSLYEQVRDHLTLPQEARGARTPWNKCDASIRFREGEVSLWHGMNHVGKTLITSQVAATLCEQDERCCIASFEMKPKLTMARMTRQAAGGPEPSIGFIRRFHQWTDGRLWIFNHLGQIQADRVVALVRFVHAKHKIRHLFVDSLMRCVKGEDDFNGQKDFVTDLCAAAMDTGVHVHLVHHTKKLSDESHRPTRYDAKGSGAISDQVDNVFGIWRNQAKERALKRDQFKDDTAREECEAKPDTVIVNDKQRHGDWTGEISLWFNARGTTFHGSKEQNPAPIVTVPGRQPGEDDEEAF